MKKGNVLIDILIGAASITAAVYFYNKFFSSDADTAKSDTALSDIAAAAIAAKNQNSKCLFPPEILYDLPFNQVDNWGTLSTQSPLNQTAND